MKCINTNHGHTGGTCAHCGEEFFGTGECPNELCQIRERTVVPFRHACPDCGQVYPAFSLPDVRGFLVLLGIGVMFLIAPCLTLFPEKELCPFFLAVTIAALIILVVFSLVQRYSRYHVEKHVVIAGLVGFIAGLAAWVCHDYYGEIASFCGNLQILGGIILDITLLAFITLCALSIRPLRMWRILWEAALAIFLMLIGIITWSGTFFFLGVVVLVTWIASQKCYKRLFELNEEQLKADKAAKNYETAPQVQTPETHKELKDLRDAVIAWIWNINYVWAARWFFRCIGFTAILLVLVFSGPGEYLYRNAVVSGILNTGKCIHNTFDFSRDIQPEVRRAIRNSLVKEFQSACFSQEEIDNIFSLGDVAMIKEVYDAEVDAGIVPGGMYAVLSKDLKAYELLVSKGLTVEDFFKVKPLLKTLDILFLLKAGYPVGQLANDAHNAGLQGTELFNYLSDSLAKPEAPVREFALLKAVLNYLQSVRRFMWGWLFVLLLVFVFILDPLFTIFMLGSWLAHKAYQAADEMHDYAVYAWEKIQEREKKKRNPQHTSSQEFQEKKTKGERAKDKLNWFHVVLIDWAMEFGQLIWKKLQPEFAHRIAVA